MKLPRLTGHRLPGQRGNTTNYGCLRSYQKAWHTPCHLPVATVTTAMTNQKPPLTHLLKELIQIGIALTSERDLGVSVDDIVPAA
jgi:hypothetical protein